MERQNRKNPSEKENAGRLETQEGCEYMTKNYGFYSKASGYVQAGEKHMIRYNV